MSDVAGKRETIDRGHAGASARAEYERRRKKDRGRRRALFGRLAPVVDLLAGPKRTTEVWGRGAQGEERIGPFLDRVIGNKGVVLHDRRVSGRRINLDHLVVVASGVWVIDTKHYSGRLARRRVVGWTAAREVLTVDGRDQTREISSAREQRAIVERALGLDIPVRAAICYIGVDLALFARSFVMEGVLITWPKALPGSLSGPGALTDASQTEVAGRLAQVFPPYLQTERRRRR